MFALLIQRIVPKMGRTGPQGRSCRPKIHPMLLALFGSRPSSAQRSLRAKAVSTASSGVADHSRIFLPQSIRR